MADTLLVISGAGITPYSARGLTQTLEPIAAIQSVRRTVNGALINLAPDQMRKYASVVSCSDVNVPPWDGLWPGMAVTVDCVTELAFPTGGAATRPVVASRTEDAYTFYRPRLQMMVLKNTVSKDEWGVTTGWELDLEEV